MIFLCLDLACRRPHFSLLRQRKVSKRKASQRPCPCGVPCATRVARGRAQTRYAQTSARPDPAAAALLSTAYGLGSPRVLVRCAHLAHACSHAARGARAAAAAAPKSMRVDHDCDVHPSWLTNPHRSLSHQHPYPAQKNQIGYLSSPSPQRG